MLYKPAINWMIIAFAVRLVACLAIHMYSLESGFEGFYPLPSGADDIQYWDYSDEIMYGRIPEFLPNSYPIFLAILFTITGKDLLIGKLFSVIAGSLTVYVGVLFARELSSDIALSQRDQDFSANFTGLLLTIYPASLFYSTQLVRDVLLVLVGLVNLYLSVIILKTRQQSLWIFWGLSFMALYSLRDYAAVSLAISLFTYLMLIWKAKINQKILLLILVIILFALIPYFLGQGIFALGRIIPMLTTDEIARQREFAYSIGGSSTGIVIDYSSPVGFIWTYGQSYLTAMFGPLPWQLGAIVQIIGLPEAICMWLLCFSLWRSRDIKARRNKMDEEILLLIFCIILVGVFSLVSDNIGTNIRLRMLPWSSLIIYASIEFAKKKSLLN